MADARISVIVTVLNEERTIQQLLDGLSAQSRQPDEVVIVDAGSQDTTLQLLKAWQKAHRGFPVHILVQKGNRSKGRNVAIKKATHSLIAITDAGCVPHKAWLLSLEKQWQKTNADVVAGYYDAGPKTPLEEAIVPYMLVMPDRVISAEFLPATRSMMIKKNIWKKLGGFDESLSVSEDYAFAKKLQQQGYTIAFAKNAKVTWLPFGSLSHFFKTVMNMAHYDAKARVVRAKVWSLFLRYLFLVVVATLSTPLAMVCIGAYLVWSVEKNRRYVPRGWWWLPVLQLVSDVGVMTGTLRGMLT